MCTRFVAITTIIDRLPEWDADWVRRVEAKFSEGSGQSRRSASKAETLEHVQAHETTPFPNLPPYSHTAMSHTAFDVSEKRQFVAQLKKGTENKETLMRLKHFVCAYRRFNTEFERAI